MAKEVLVDDRMITLQVLALHSNKFSRCTILPAKRDTRVSVRHKTNSHLLGSAFYRGADCCVIVYDITNQKSFESIENWRQDFLNQGAPKDPETFPFVLLGIV
jgi:Ras-related protein Rab-7A